ncbi:hypothetical protein, partial [Vibrio sp. 99-70-13A1]|uniref:hypothetical protein n=1 Tax=Vibrio sp. 99-70-13A1 TaxID=2607601 RepID=UPI001C128AAD
MSNNTHKWRTHNLFCDFKHELVLQMRLVCNGLRAVFLADFCNQVFTSNVRMPHNTRELTLLTTYFVAPHKSVSYTHL